MGGEIEIPTLGGEIKLKIPTETQSGKMFRLKGKGVPAIRGGIQGDLFCKIVVETPVNLTRRQKDLLLTFDRELNDGQNHSPKSSSWFSSVKKFFEGL
ncbi:MAG: chaperone protein [uncultured bacterium]|nr:MAG: chaperone protein [uncultured bacterium]